MARPEWITQGLPRGEDLPIGCAYRFSFGKRRPDEGDLPEGWRVENEAEDDEVLEAGWEDVHDLHDLREAVLADLPPGSTVGFTYLRNPEGALVATWDEGRWWTPEEGHAFTMMAQVPAVYMMSEAARSQSLPRWMRRRLK